MEKENAVQEELAKLDEQWMVFQDSERAILHWRFKAGDEQLSQAYVAVKEQLDEDEPELFVQLKTPFNRAEDYGWDLAKELIRRVSAGIHEANSQDNSQDNSNASTDTDPDDLLIWKVPDLRAITNGFQALFATCQAVLDQFQDELERVVLVIAPTRVKDVAGYQQWWRSACDLKARYSGWPKNLQWVVIDSAEQPLLLSQFEDQPQVLSLPANVDVQAAIKKIAQEANDGSAGAQLRMHLLDMNEAIAKGDEKQLVQASALALPLTQANEWLDVWATVLMTRAGGWLNANQFERAINDYREAQVLAAQGLAIETPGCDKLLLQSMLCEGTGLFMADELEDAATAYQKTGVKAQELKDPWMALEGWRMASFCLERRKQKDKAWECASRAFEVGKSMEQEQREASTLMFVGQALLRLSPNTQVRQEVTTVFEQWLGESWQEQLERAAT